MPSDDWWDEVPSAQLNKEEERQKDTWSFSKLTSVLFELFPPTPGKLNRDTPSDEWPKD